MTTPPGGRDPLAVALANASLLGLGYRMLGRRRLATRTTWVTAALVVLQAVFVRSAWLQAGLALWWFALIVHGWWLARSVRQPVREMRAERLRALAVVVPVLLAVGFVYVQAEGIGADTAAAHRAGDCERAVRIADRLTVAHRLVDAPLAVRADGDTEACWIVIGAARQAPANPLLAANTLTMYGEHPQARWPGWRARRADLFVTQAINELHRGEPPQQAFGHLADALVADPGGASRVSRAIDAYLGTLPTQDACDATIVMDWIAARDTTGSALDRAAEALPRIAPTSLLGCADELVKDEEFDEARSRYEQFLDQYPDDDRAARARAAMRAAELDRVRALLRANPEGYCSDPAPFPAARPYGGAGPHRALLLGRDDHRAKLPSSWVTKDPAKAELIICAGATRRGRTVATCPYHSLLSGRWTVRFHARKIPVQVYALRTGKRVGGSSLQIGGDSCPSLVHYMTSAGVDLGPPRDMYVKTAASDIRAAYGTILG